MFCFTFKSLVTQAAYFDADCEHLAINVGYCFKCWRARFRFSMPLLVRLDAALAVYLEFPVYE